MGTEEAMSFEFLPYYLDSQGNSQPYYYNPGVLSSAVTTTQTNLDPTFG